MDALTTAAASGLRARTETLDILANNLANTSTPGFKADREFYQVFQSELAAPGADSRVPPRLPDIVENWIDLRPGALRHTSNPWDFALEGRGFLVAENANGPVYLRGGTVHRGDDGTIRTEEGYPLRVVLPDGARRPLRIPPGAGAEFRVDADGTVRVQGQTLGRLELVDVPERALEKQGSGYYRLSGTAGLIKDAGARVRQGALEESNVQPAEAAVQLVATLRNFGMLERALSIGGEMNRRSIEEVARVAS